MAMAISFLTSAIAKNMLKPKCTSIPTDHNQTPQRISKLTSLQHPELPRSSNGPKLGLSTAILSAIVSSSDPAWAAQQVADSAEGDNRFLILILPIVVAISWVLFNIFGPALNQIERMRSEKGIILGLGLGGLVASNFLYRTESLASETAMTGETVDGNQISLLLVFIGAALTWVLYKTLLQPVLDQKQ